MRNVVVPIRSLVPFATCMSLLRVVGERRNAPPGLHRGRAGRMPVPPAGHAPKSPNLSLSILSGLLAGHRGMRGNANGAC